MWDAFQAADDENSINFEEIVSSSQECMQGNNDVLGSIARNPWWLVYAQAGLVALVSVVVFLLYSR